MSTSVLDREVTLDLRPVSPDWSTLDRALGVPTAEFQLPARAAYGPDWWTWLDWMDQLRRRTVAAPGPGTITITSLNTSGDFSTNNQSTSAATSYTSAVNYAATANQPIYVHVYGSRATGLNAPTVTFDPLGTPQTLTWIPRMRAQLTSSTNQSWVYGFIPSSTLSAPLKFDFGAQTSTSCIWNVFTASGVDVTGGILGTVITDSCMTTGSLANAATIRVQVQAAWHANNVNLSFLHLGTNDGASGTLAATSPMTVVSQQGHTTATTTLALAKSAAGGRVQEEWTWTGSFSNIGMSLELKASSTTSPSLKCAFLGSVSSTVGATSYTVPSVTVGAGNYWLLGVLHSRSAAGSVDPSSIGGTLSATWAKQAAGLLLNDGTDDRRLTVWKSSNATGAGTVIVDFAGVMQSGCDAILLEFAGVASSGQVVQYVTASHAATDTAPTLTMGAFGPATNGTVAFVGQDTSAAMPILRAVGGMQVAENDFAVTVDDARASVDYGTPIVGLTAIWVHGNIAAPGGTLLAGTQWLMGAAELAAA